jgi:hypothetical protein
MSDLPYNDILHAAHLSDYKIRKIPIAGKWLSRAGHVTNILATPCSTTPQLWVEGLFYAAPRLIYLKTKPFKEAEVAYRYLNTRCGGKKNRGLLRRIADGLKIQDPDTQMKHLGGPTTKAVFTIAGDFALKALWYLMIVDRVTEAAYNWTSLVYQWAGCPVTGEPHAEAVIHPGENFAHDGSTVNGWFTVDESKGMLVKADGILIGAHIGASITYNIESIADIHNDGPLAIDTQLMIIRGGAEPEALTPRISASLTSTGTFMATDTSFYSGGPTTLQSMAYVRLWKFGDKQLAIQGTMKAYGGRYPGGGLFYDP